MFAETFNDHFRLIALLERAGDHPEGLSGLRRNKGEINRVLENNGAAIRLLRDIGEHGESFCDERAPGTRSDPNDARERRASSDAWRSDAANLIVNGQREAEQAARDLKRWLKNAEIVTICDPYILHFSVRGRDAITLLRSAEDYVSFISDLIPASAGHDKLFGCGYTREIKTAIRRKLKQGQTLEIFDTRLLHDRYIIKNNVDGRMLGSRPVRSLASRPAASAHLRAVDPMAIEVQPEIQGPVSLSKCRSNRHTKAASAEQIIGRARNQSM
jgi:hypothetical protein